VSKAGDLLEAARQRPQNFRFAELVALAEAAGFVLKRVKGDHYILTRPRTPEILNFQPMNGQAKPYQIRQLLEVIERRRISVT
jgi:predicted RNA binding protein YcfA (HicA-like mRNA interferase family)